MVVGLESAALHPIGLDLSFGAVAQLGERLICIQEVAGSIPTSSTSLVTDSVGSLLPFWACSSGG